MSAVSDPLSAQDKASANRAFSRTPSSWDPQDDLLLRHLKEQRKLGWKEIAAHFKHRTPNACQFRWRRLRSGVLKNAGNNPAASPSLINSNIHLVSGGITKKPSSAGSGSQGNGSSSNITGALAGLSALSNGARTASPIPQSGGDSKGAASSMNSFGESSGSTLFSSHVNKARGQNINPGYSQWSFTSSTNGNTNNVGSPENDPLSNSISSLNSSDSNASNKNSFNMYHPDQMSIGSFSLQGFSQNFLNSYNNEIWRPDEDELLLSKRRRELSLAELSILLPTRSEEDIITRIKELDQNTSSQRTIVRGGGSGSGGGGSGSTSIIGENDSQSDYGTTVNGNVASRLNSQSSGYGLHTLSRTLSASSQISLNSNNSSFTNVNPVSNGSNNSTNTITNSQQDTRPNIMGGVSLLSFHDNSSPITSNKSSPLIASKQLTDLSARGGGMNISSIRRTLSQTSNGSKVTLPFFSSKVETDDDNDDKEKK